ncbi:MAG: DUF4340 domain-containing protein [Deltaproteobacteria bacterium]|nr:DUF4340 domain-containing protein [Deltaproteobacteria bacterium]MBP7290243.1 DUF4340 domain-containing protein [Nannocystaceae bacterium]
MNRGTVIMVALALGSAALAWSMRPQEVAAGAYEDTGELLAPGFTDPTLATSLEVVTWDEKSAKVVRFAVEQKQGRWVIPSHNDYPADGTERMGKAAASFIDVKKDLYYGDNAAEQGSFGVLDPAGADGKGDERGQHITIKDASGATLVDVIVGKQIPEKQGFYYLRAPSEKRVYGAKLELDISTNFTDWIEKDLLHVERDEVVTMFYDPYTVDEQAGQVIGSKPIQAELEQVDGKDEWVASAGVEVPEGKLLDPAKVKQIVTAIANIKIVGVRPRPEQLTPGKMQLTPQMQQVLQSKGFFLAPTGGGGARLMGNEGEARVVTKDGVVYSLYFGEVTYDSGLALTAGAEEEGAEPAPVMEGEDPEDKKTANRYMFVDVSYDPSMDKQGGAPEPAAEGEDAAKKLHGQARAQQLQERFGSWFYVIPDMSYKQVHKERTELWKAAPAPKDGGSAPTGGTPGGAPTGGDTPAKPKPAPKPAPKDDGAAPPPSP